MKLLIVDGSNVVMRAAFGGSVPPEDAVRVATGMIEKACRQLGATHLVVALDCPGTRSWRKELFSDYKANRSTDTRPWIEAAAQAWLRRQLWVEAMDGYEADDVIATVATRAVNRAASSATEVLVFTSDSDLQQLATNRVQIVRPVNGGGMQPLSVAEICERNGVLTPARLADLKALTGESGDNIPGVAGIGPVRAQKLLATHESLEGVIAAGTTQGESDAVDKFAAKVAAAAELARLCYRLASLVVDVPLQPIMPSECRVNF